MRYGSIRLVNYIGIYNGMGLDTIYINLKKCKNNTIVIKGSNGSGKSTLMNALNPLPDSNDSFIPEKEAVKELEVIDNNITYKLKFIHPIKSNGERATTKAYIRQCSVDGEIELNPNGNVGSFKDVLFSEFSLDPNFVSLSQLGSEDRGMVDKTPSERKKFINSIINKLETYNDIYKTLTKRSSAFKSIVNRLVSKIDNIGDKNKIIMSLKSIENRINQMIDEKDKLLEELSSYKSTIKLIDPDGSIQNLYNNIYNGIVSIDDNIKTIDRKINKYDMIDPNQSIDDQLDSLSNKYKSISSKINDLNNNIHVLENEISYLLSDRESESKQLNTKTQRLNSLSDNKNFSDIIESLKYNRNIMKEYRAILDKIGFDSVVNISKDEYLLGLNTLKDIKSNIDTIKSNIDNNIMEVAINEYIKKDILPDLEGVNNKILDIQNKIHIAEKDLQHNESLLGISQKLKLRPNQCNIDSCAFIKDAIDAMNKNPKDNISEINNTLSNYRSLLDSYKKDMRNLSDINECILILNRMIRSIESNMYILKKIPNTENIINYDVLLDRILIQDTFNEIDDLYSHIQYCDIFEDYLIIQNNISKLEKDYEIYESKNSIINDISNDIEKLNKKLDHITKTIENNRDIIFNNKKKKDELDIIKDRYLDAISLIESKKKISSDRAELMSKFYTIQSNIEKIKNSKDNIYRIESKIEEVNKSISPMIEDRDELKHSIRLLEEYNSDLEIYNAKYEKIKNVRYYCTPTTGIQVLYIELYMNKTLSMTNELLSHVFNGDFILQPYIINEKEFRIPCIGEGLPRDDISSLSNSQKSIISMILSFVLLKHSSTKYNILKLDEIDSPLDETNRIRFTMLMESLMELLEVEQCIMISHNSELNLDNCDLIVLKTEMGQSYSGNIIYQY